MKFKNIIRISLTIYVLILVIFGIYIKNSKTLQSITDSSKNDMCLVNNFNEFEFMYYEDFVLNARPYIEGITTIRRNKNYICKSENRYVLFSKNRLLIEENNISKEDIEMYYNIVPKEDERSIKETSYEWANVKYKGKIITYYDGVYHTLFMGYAVDELTEELIDTIDIVESTYIKSLGENYEE